MYPPTTSTGTKIKRSKGLAMMGTTIEASICKSNWRESRYDRGKCSSTQPMSLENRLRILPIGFESKNKTGAFRMASTILSWRRSEHFKEAQRKINALIALNMKDARTRHPCMIKFVTSFCSSWLFSIKNESHTSGKTTMATKRKGKNYTGWEELSFVQD